MNEKVVLTAEGYDRVDGRNAYHSAIKRLTLGAPHWEENQDMQIAAPCFALGKRIVSLCSMTRRSPRWNGLAYREGSSL